MTDPAHGAERVRAAWDQIQRDCTAEYGIRLSTLKAWGDLNDALTAAQEEIARKDAWIAEYHKTLAAKTEATRRPTAQRDANYQVGIDAGRRLEEERIAQIIGPNVPTICERCATCPCGAPAGMQAEIAAALRAPGAARRDGGDDPRTLLRQS